MTTRGQLGPGAVITVTDAVEEIGGRAARVRRWLRSRGLVRQTPIGERVVWGDVLDEIRLGGPKDDEPPPARLERATLRPRRVRK